MATGAHTTGAADLLDIEVRFQACPLPVSAREKQALLQDSARLRETCEAFVVALGLRVADRVSVRATGRVVAYIHKQFGLPVPRDDVLYSELMSSTSSGGTFAVNNEEFLNFVQDVLCQCLQDLPLTTKRPSSAPWPTVAAAAPEGLITVTLQKLSGESIQVEVDDKETPLALGSEVQAAFGILDSCQRFVLGERPLDTRRLLFQQAVVSGSVINVVHAAPQATLLRIRRCNLGRSAGSEGSCAPNEEAGNQEPSRADVAEATARKARKTEEARRAFAEGIRQKRAKEEEQDMEEEAPSQKFPQVHVPVPAASHARASAAHKGGRRVFREHRIAGA